jgi:hypothetical protein
MVFEPIHDTRTLPSQRQNHDGLVERKYPMAGNHEVVRLSLFSSFFCRR